MSGWSAYPFHSYQSGTLYGIKMIHDSDLKVGISQINEHLNGIDAIIEEIEESNASELEFKLHYVMVSFFIAGLTSMAEGFRLQMDEPEKDPLQCLRDAIELIEKEKLGHSIRHH